jgi:hypothetical protein
VETKNKAGPTGPAFARHGVGNGFNGENESIWNHLESKIESAMAALRDPRWENAAQHLAAGKHGEGRTLAEEAAEIAGYDPVASSFKSNARKFIQHPHIRVRVAEIQKAGAALASVSAGSLILEADEARVKAMRERAGAAAAVSAIVCKAKLAGVWRERSELSGPNGGPVPLTNITPTEAAL